MHVVVAGRWASEPARSSRRRAIVTTVVRSVWARIAAPRLDARLACCPGASLASVGEPRGVAITQIWSTESSSALYRPAYREELYERARAALFALGSRVAAGTAPLRR